MAIKAVIIGFSHMHVNEIALYINDAEGMELCAAADVPSQTETIAPKRYTPAWNLQNVRENYCSNIYDDYRKMLDEVKPDIAFILTENGQKPEVVSECAKRGVNYLIKNKNAWPRFCNDKSLAEGYMRNDIDKKTARERIAVGCNWMCVPGKEFPMNDTVKINIAKVMEEALKDLRKEERRSTERLFDLYEAHLKKAIEVTAAGINLHLDHQWEVTPELVMNLMMKDSIEKGEDISQCAELFTVGIDGAGLAVVADSFGALEDRVENEHLLSWDDMFEALDNNFENERTRLILNSAPKYCSGNSSADRWAKRLTKSWVGLVKAQEMPEGRQLVVDRFLSADRQ